MNTRHFCSADPWEVSRSAELTYRAHAAAYERYRHAPVVVSIDIYNLEAEAYGATVARPQGNGIPAIVEPFCRTIDELAQLPPFDPANDGRIPMILDVARRLAHDFPEADVRIPMAGPMSIAVNLMGVAPLLVEIASRPDRAGRALMHLVDGQSGFCRGCGRCGPSTSPSSSPAAAPPLLSPRMFREVELPGA